MTHCLMSRSWVLEGLSVAALSPSPSPCAPASERVGNGDGGLWSGSGIADAWIAVCGN